MPKLRALLRGAALMVGAHCGFASSLCHAYGAAETTTAAEPSWQLVASPYTYHHGHSPEHRDVVLLGIERVQPDDSLWGAAIFRNSFGQPSGYAYFGQQWDDLFGVPSLYGKVTFGIIYGYKGKFKDKVPFNHGGFAPVIIPGIGYRLTPKDSLEVVALGINGLLFAYIRKL